jgi:hypothetical protein
VTALVAVQYLQATRGTVADWNPPMLEDFLRTYNTPDWEMLDARIQAFASEPVWESMQAVIEAYKVLPALHLKASPPEPSHAERILAPRVTTAGYPVLACPPGRATGGVMTAYRNASPAS